MTIDEAKEMFWQVSRDGKAGVFEKAMDIQYTKVVSSYYIGSEFDNFIEKIYSEFKLELEAEYKRGQDSILSRSCEGCKYFNLETGNQPDGLQWERVECELGIVNQCMDCDYSKVSCDDWEQK